MSRKLNSKVERVTTEANNEFAEARTVPEHRLKDWARTRCYAQK
jgi:hypothetical protein